MASTRSNATRGAARAAATETPTFAALARGAARIRIAALGAAGKKLTGWAQAADWFAQALGNELLRPVDGETDSAELIAGVTAATRLHLRELTALPRAGADHFDSRPARLSTTRRSR